MHMPPDAPLAFSPDDEAAWQRLARGYRLAGLLVSTHRLGLLQVLAQGQATLDALAGELKADEQVVEQMCRALSSAGLLQAGDFGWRLTEAGHRLAEEPAALAELDSLARDYDQWGTLHTRARELATDPPLAVPDAFGGEDDIATAHRYALRLAARHRGQARRLLGHLTPTRPVRVMDVGGADGFLAREVCARWPAAECIVLEVPAMAAVARQACADEPRISVLDGDYLGNGQRPGTQQLPDGIDVVVLSHVLQGIAEEPQRQLVSRAAAALNPGGCLLSFESVLRSDERGPIDTILWAVEQAAQGHRGRLITSVEQDMLLRAAGLAASAAWWVSDSSRAVVGVRTAAGVTPAVNTRAEVPA